MPMRFTLNGKEITTDKEKKLLSFLRDDMHLMGTKDGCSEGICGTCTVIIDGKARKSCTIPLSKVEGKNVITIEGLTEKEKEIYSYAFGKAGAVQCGFCTPGMVMSAKALLDENNNPSEEEIRKAIRGNLCRCTGYEKIVRGIELAAKILRGECSLEEENKDGAIGDDIIRLDATDKVLGRALYADDLRRVLPRRRRGRPARRRIPRRLGGRPSRRGRKRRGQSPRILKNPARSKIRAGSLTCRWRHRRRRCRI